MAVPPPDTSVPRRRALFRAATVAASVLLALLLAECGYRALLLARRPGASYRVTPSVAADHDERHGEALRPGAEYWMTAVEDGEVRWTRRYFRVNPDGVGGGRTRIADYDAAEVRALAFGDSFTHWSQDDLTWPDVAEARLSADAGRRAAILNYGRGGYGVLQMLDLAADMVERHRPDLVVIAVIGVDLDRARWWKREVVRGGETRWLLSTRRDGFDDPTITRDVAIVEPRATWAWAERLLAGRPEGLDRALLSELDARAARLAKEYEQVGGDGLDMLSPRRSYLWSRIVEGRAYVPGRMGSFLPTIAIDDYAQDEGAVRACARLRASGARIVPVYLPGADELRRGESRLTARSRSLLASLERMLGARCRTLYSPADRAAPVPAVMDLMPLDMHPSADGIRFYGECVGALCARELGAAALTPRASPRPGSASPPAAPAGSRPAGP